MTNSDLMAKVVFRPRNFFVVLSLVTFLPSHHLRLMNLRPCNYFVIHLWLGSISACLWPFISFSFMSQQNWSRTSVKWAGKAFIIVQSPGVIKNVHPNSSPRSRPLQAQREPFNWSKTIIIVLIDYGTSGWMEIKGRVVVKCDFIDVCHMSPRKTFFRFVPSTLCVITD